MCPSTSFSEREEQSPFCLGEPLFQSINVASWYASVMARQYLPPGLTLLEKQNVETRGNQPPVLLGIVTVRDCTGTLCACGSSKAGQCLSIRLCRQSTVLTACDHTAGMDPIVSNLWACVEFGWLLREPGKDNTDLAFLVPTWLTCYRCGFNPVFTHVITDVRVVALHPAPLSLNWSGRWTDESCPQ